MSATNKQPWTCDGCGLTFPASSKASTGSSDGGRAVYLCADCTPKGDDHDAADWWKHGGEFESAEFPTEVEPREAERALSVRQRPEDQEMLRHIAFDAHGVGINSEATAQWLARQSAEAKRDGPRAGELPSGRPAGSKADVVHDPLSKLEVAILKLAIAIAKLLIVAYRLAARTMRQIMAVEKRAKKPEQKD